MKFSKKFFLANKIVSEKTKPLLVAEISANHCGSLDLAKELILSAKRNGADFVKLQTYEANTMTFKTNKKDFLIKDGLWKGKTLWQLYDKAKTPFSWQKTLFSYAKSIGITCFSTPFDETAVDLLEKLKCPFYKISSFENLDLNLIKKVALTKKPVILSTGLVNLNKLKVSVETLYKYGSKKIIILYCVSAYPASFKDFNINKINLIQKNFNCLVGLSDHSNENLIGISAVNHGAILFEKHYALPNQKKGFDIKFSKKGNELKEYKRDLNNSWLINNNNSKSKNESINIRFKRSLYSSKNILKGEKFTCDNIRSVRPGYGLSPDNYFKIIGRRAKKNIRMFEPIKKSLVY